MPRDEPSIPFSGKVAAAAAIVVLLVSIGVLLDRAYEDVIQGLPWPHSSLVLILVVLVVAAGAAAWLRGARRGR